MSKITRKTLSVKKLDNWIDRAIRKHALENCTHYKISMLDIVNDIDQCDKSIVSGENTLSKGAVIQLVNRLIVGDLHDISVDIWNKVRKHFKD